MIVRAIDSQGDWTFGLGRNNYIKEQVALVQQVRCRLYSFLNDCFFDLAAGLDWFNLMGGKDLTAVQLAISATILNTPGVIGIRQLSLVLDRTTRVLTISYEATTIYSTVTSSFQFSFQI